MDNTLNSLNESLQFKFHFFVFMKACSFCASEMVKLKLLHKITNLLNSLDDKRSNIKDLR